uniref:Mannose-P-dolichol utilization defect 1 protein homolog n=1 Tax=Blastobotrys adeninivorans TaxID=409370 RepID=A0A060TGL9_BLAAD
MEVIGKTLDALTPVIRPIAHNLPEPVHKLGEVMLDDASCYQTLLRDVDFVSRPECVSLGVSKGLSWGIVGLSSVVKVPQILKLVSSGSSQGLSLVSYILETVGYLVSTAYAFRSNFPFSSFGETILISIQNVILTGLICFYSGKGSVGMLLVGVMIGVFYQLVQSEGAVSYSNLVYLQGLTVPLSMLSKVPQIYSNYQRKSTGQLSMFTVVNYLLGSLARVFTTLQEVDDVLILASFVLATVLNAVLFLQVLAYWKVKTA